MLNGACNSTLGISSGEFVAWRLKKFKFFVYRAYIRVDIVPRINDLVSLQHCFVCSIRSILIHDIRPHKWVFLCRYPEVSSFAHQPMAELFLDALSFFSRHR
jgi:hypothetical protein